VAQRPTKRHANQPASQPAGRPASQLSRNAIKHANTLTRNAHPPSNLSQTSQTRRQAGGQASKPRRAPRNKHTRPAAKTTKQAHQRSKRQTI
jgi:hypothetical protein